MYKGNEFFSFTTIEKEVPPTVLTSDKIGLTRDFPGQIVTICILVTYRSLNVYYAYGSTMVIQFPYAVMSE